MRTSGQLLRSKKGTPTSVHFGAFSSQLSLFVPPPPVHISVAMEEAEDEINIKISTLELKMKQLTVDTAIDEDLETYQ